MPRHNRVSRESAARMSGHRKRLAESKAPRETTTINCLRTKVPDTTKTDWSKARPVTAVATSDRNLPAKAAAARELPSRAPELGKAREAVLDRARARAEAAVHRDRAPHRRGGVVVWGEPSRDAIPDPSQPDLPPRCISPLRLRSLSAVSNSSPAYRSKP
jgi:hypothetical protein